MIAGIGLLSRPRYGGQEKIMNRRNAASLAAIASLAVSLAYGPYVIAQTGAPGTKQMQDAQRKAGEKARAAKKTPNHQADAQKAGSAAAASAP
jgi:hypothetical protein